MLILLDRDGVINFDSTDYIKTPDEWRALPGALEAIVRLRQAGHQIAVCSNQAGVGRGIFNEAALASIHSKMIEQLRALGGDLDGLIFCPHHPDAQCECRKPKPGMLLKMIRQLRTEPSATCYVGDSLTDAQAALAAGCEPVLVRTGRGSGTEGPAMALGVTRVYDDLAQFATAQLACTRS